jgi:amino acid adenylation domain-containing protein
MSANTLKGFPLSLQQAHLYTVTEAIQSRRILCRVLLEGVLSDDALQKALKNIISRYSILRTCFYTPPGMDMPMQVVSPEAEMVYKKEDLSALTGEQQAARLAALFSDLKEWPFALERGPLLHVVLTRTGPQAAQLLLCLPALCADTVTFRLLLSELSQEYEAIVCGNVSVAEQQLQYTDFSAWQDDLLQEDEAAGSPTCWDQIDLTRRSTQPFPFHSGVSSVAEQAMQAAEASIPGLQKLVLPGECAQHLQQFSRQSVMPVEAILLTIWQIALSRLTNEPELLLGVSCDGRNYEELEAMPGCCTCVVPMATYFNDECTFAQAVIAIFALLEQAREQQMSFSWSKLEPATETSSLFFPLTFEYVCWPQNWKTDTLSFSYIEEYSYLERFTLKFRVNQVGQTYQLEFHYDARYFTTEQIERIGATVLVLLQGALLRPSEPVGHLGLLSETEQRHLLEQWHGSREMFVYQPLTHLFEAQVSRVPSATAVICSGQSLTYEQLNQRANRLAHWLRKRGVGSGVPVSLYVERGIDMLIGLLGILKAGGAYVPLDPALPKARLEQQLTSIESPVLLTQQALADHLPAFSGEILCLELVAGLVEETKNLEIAIEPEHLAYIIYTSGSTGNPKGVAIYQQSVSNYVQDMCLRLAPSSGLQFATVSTLAADLGNTAIFCSLASGGCLHILLYEVVTSGEAMARYIDQYPVDVLKIVPSHLSALLASGQGRRVLPRKYLILGGELLSWSLVDQIQVTGCTCEIVNHYGPTETTIGVLVNELSKRVSSRQESASVPLGIPIANTRFIIVDQNHALVPVDVPGELWIGGAGLAAGYQGNAELTDRCFPMYPLQPEPERFYRTGDRVRYTAWGQIEFLGRIDRQIKLRGYRIEPGDIEAALQGHSQVRESIVLLVESTPGEPRLVAYALMTRKYARDMPEGAELRRFLSEKLPAYMLPTVVIPVSEWPLTVNGKIDRQQLKMLDQQPLEKTMLAPRDHVEFELARIWENLLHIWPLSVRDNFFDLGGHSILAVALIAQIQRVFGLDLPVTTLFQHPTIETLASIIRTDAEADQWQTIVPIRTSGSNPPLFCVHPAGGTAFCYYDLARYLGPDQQVYGIQTFAPEVWEETTFTVVELAGKYITALRKLQPHGPYALSGWSAGGVIAFEMACQLLQQDEKISLLALFDSSAPVPSAESSAPPDLNDAALARSIFEELQLASSARPLDALLEEERLAYVLAQAKEHNRVPQDIDIVRFRRFASMQKSLLYALRSYHPAVYAGRITLFRTQTSAAIESEPVPSLSGPISSACADRWSRFSSTELEIFMVPGEHATLMNEPDVETLAATLSRCLTQGTLERE